MHFQCWKANEVKLIALDIAGDWDPELDREILD